MKRAARGCLLTGVMLIGTTGFSIGGTILPPELPEVSAATPVEDAQDRLLEDGQKVLFTFTEGISSQEKGSKGKGKFVHLFRTGSSNFGPAKILSHTGTSLTFRGKRDTCIMTSDMKVSCKKIGSGTWRVM